MKAGDDSSSVNISFEPNDEQNIEHEDEEPNDLFTSSRSLSEGDISSHFSPALVEGIEATPTMSDGRKESSMILIWENISFEVVKRKWTKFGRNSSTLQILRPQSGRAAAGTLTAVIGPSGAGKSTLLRCLSGREEQGVGGRVFVSRPGSPVKRKVSVAFIPESNLLLKTLTVRESLLFSSKINNFLDIGCNHDKLVSDLMKSVDIDCCSDLVVSKCSGGQVKRLSFAVELIAKPDVLVMDEPTSGLDSSTAFQCVKLLRRLTQEGPKPPAIITTVHQPSAKLFNTFHQVYLLSKSGQCLYFGPPASLLLHFSTIGLICPHFSNPADFALEVAFGDFGEKTCNRLQHFNRVKQTLPFDPVAKTDIREVANTTINKRVPTSRHIWLLWKRTWLNMFRGTMFLWLRLTQNIIVALILSFLWSYKTGEEDGCWASSPESLKGVSENSKSLLLRKMASITDNTAFLFTTGIYMVIGSLTATLLEFPLEVAVFMKERSNGWYNCWTYFAAKFLAELPVQLLTTFSFCIIVYPLTGQISSSWRFLSFYGINCLIGLISESIGSLIGAIFLTDLMGAVFMAPGLVVPVFIFGGYFVRLSKMPCFLKPMAYISYLRYAFESILVVVYGFGRCQAGGPRLLQVVSQPKNPLNVLDIVSNDMNISQADNDLLPSIIGVNKVCLLKVTNFLDSLSQKAANTSEASGDNEASYIMSFFELNESLLLPNVFVLIAFFIALKLATYLLLLFRTKQRR